MIVPDCRAPVGDLAEGGEAPKKTFAVTNAQPAADLLAQPGAEPEDQRDGVPLPKEADKFVPSLLEAALRLRPGSVREVQVSMHGARRASEGGRDVGVGTEDPALNGAPRIIEEVDHALGDECINGALDVLPEELDGVEEAVNEARPEALDGTPEATLVPARNRAIPCLAEGVEDGGEKIHQSNVIAEHLCDVVAHGPNEVSNLIEAEAAKDALDPVEDPDGLDEVQRIAKEEHPADDGDEARERLAHQLE